MNHRRSVSIGGASFIVALFALVTWPMWHLGLAQAGFTACPTGWTSSIELDPTATDPVSQGDDHARCIRSMTRDRIETETDFGEFGNISTDTGRLLEGAARAFFDDTQPTVAGAITDACLAENDYDGNRGCDEGRLWIDSNDQNKIYACDDTDSDGDCDAFEAVTAGAATLTVSRAVVTDGSGVLAAATTTATEVGYVNGVTSSIQTQLNLKAPLASPTFTGTVTTPLTASRAVVTGASSELAASVTTTTELALLSGQTSKAGRVLLATYSPSSSASVNVTSILSATYRFYHVKFSLVPATDDVELYWRSDESNGASFDAGASDYAYANFDLFGARLGDIFGGDAFTTTLGSAVALVGGSSFLAAGIGSGATEGITGEMHFDTVLKMSTSTYGHFQADATAYNTGTATAQRLGGGAINALQIIFGSGNIASGFVQVYGDVQ